MNWNVLYLPEANKDLDSLSRQQQILVKKAIKKVQANPLPQNERGYGKPLGHQFRPGHALSILNTVVLSELGKQECRDHV